MDEDGMEKVKRINRNQHIMLEISIELIDLVCIVRTHSKRTLFLLHQTNIKLKKRTKKTKFLNYCHTTVTRTAFGSFNLTHKLCKKQKQQQLEEKEKEWNDTQRAVPFRWHGSDG